MIASQEGRDLWKGKGYCDKGRERNAKKGKTNSSKKKTSIWKKRKFLDYISLFILKIKVEAERGKDEERKNHMKKTSLDIIWEMFIQSELDMGDGNWHWDLGNFLQFYITKLVSFKESFSFLFFLFFNGPMKCSLQSKGLDICSPAPLVWYLWKKIAGDCENKTLTLPTGNLQFYRGDDLYLK